MIAAYGTAGRAVWSLARQTGLSILGTIAATAILAGIRAEWPRPAASPAIEASSNLTSGGKFTTRAGSGEPNPFVSLMVLPPILPMFTAPTVPVLRVAPAPAVVLLANGPDTSHAPHPPAVPRRDGRRTPAVAEHPPRRVSAPVIEMAALPDLPALPTAEPTLWTRSKATYERVIAWGGSLGEHLLP